MASCRCGFVDEHGSLWTDATIVYFNETDGQTAFSQNFDTLSFLNEYEDGYSTTYRQSASEEAVSLTDGQSLDMTCHVPTNQRIVVGAEVVTRRKDIQYGTFRSGMIPPESDVGGTAFTMEYNFNISQKITLELLNQDLAQNTKLEYSVGLPGATVSPYASNISQNPFIYAGSEYRFDWSDRSVNWQASLNTSATFKIEASGSRTMPSIPGALRFRHWSDGDPLHAQGPPKVTAEVGKLMYIRFFYNGTTSKANFDTSCAQSGDKICDAEDNSLRSSTMYGPEAMVPWKYEPKQYSPSKAATLTTLIPLAFFVLIFVHALVGRLIRSYNVRKSGKPKNPAAYVFVMDKSHGNVETWSVPKSPASSIKKSSVRTSVTEVDDSFLSSVSLPTMYEIGRSANATTATLNTLKTPAFQSKPKGITTTGLPVEKVLLSTRPRMDYLDGFRGVVCVLVSFIHFFLTFYIGAINPSTPVHYSFETWFRKICSPVVLNASIVLGCFFILSARLIGVRYLRNRNLEELAGSTYRRIPRLFVPVMMAVTVEYFLISVGAVKWLRYLASITWSTWPYTVQFQNAGYFFNELLALLFIIPNALPKIIYNYCTGVLWTIPVNIQYSWLCFLGVVVIKESKSPWKRFLYYTICILTNWYALNWGAYFWVGLAIGDLDSTYKYRNWFRNPWRKAALMICLWSIILAFMALQYLQQVEIINFPTLEYGIHPDIYTGLPITQTDLSGFPPFNYPQVYAFFIGTALLVLCDISTVAQQLFSLKWLRILGVHSYSIYLLHGAVFWSWGAWLAVRLHVAGLPYWANTLVVFLTSYGLLFGACFFWTPIADVYAMILSTSLWRYMQGKSLYKTIS